MNKNKLFGLILFWMFTLSAQAESVTPYKGSRMFWDLSSRTKVFTNGWYSRIIQLQDGRLIAACEGDGINISFSSNKGSSWSSPTKIATTNNNIPNRVPDLIQLKNGTIIVAYNPRPSTPYTDDRKFGIRCKRSTDNGSTWSDEIFINDAQSTFDNGCWEPSMLELPSGELQLYFADEGPYTSNSDQQISLCRSFDGGQTWTAAQKISYRSGYRDGMPVPVLLKDQSDIVVVLEDNGWPGVGDFLPTTVRCPLTTNWNNYFVDGGSSNRKKTLDFDYCPLVKGGAPYLRVLPWGETILSYQSNYNNGDNLIMFTAVGDEKAENFKALSNPFITSSSDVVMWNSVAVVDTGSVIAVGGVNNNIEMIKGYPVRLLQAPYGTPVVDGIQTKNEGYYKPAATQMMLGTQIGVRSIADFAYDDKNLYFTARVSDKTQVATGSTRDGVRLLLDVDDVSDKKPQKGVFCLFFNIGGTYQMWQGNEGSWALNNSTEIEYKINAQSSYYVVEAAIPWSVLGKTSAPVGQRMASTVEIQDRRDETTYTERLPDAKLNESWTWMEFRLQDKPTTSVADKEVKNDVSITVNDNLISVNTDTPLRKSSLFSANGIKIGDYYGKNIRLKDNLSGVGILKVYLENDDIITKKIIY